MEGSTKTRIRRQVASGGDAAERAARHWLIRRLRWENRLTELRAKAAR
jgi:hypothetical protein